MSVDVTVNLTPPPALDVTITPPPAIEVTVTPPAATEVTVTPPPALEVTVTPPPPIVVRVGSGVPPGGSTGQVLAKTSGSDYAVEWVSVASAFDAALSGDQDGVNAEFSLPAAYVAGSLRVYINGLRQRGGTDFSETTSTTITFSEPPIASDVLTADYQPA